MRNPFIAPIFFLWLVLFLTACVPSTLNQLPIPFSEDEGIVEVSQLEQCLDVVIVGSTPLDSIGFLVQGADISANIPDESFVGTQGGQYTFYNFKNISASQDNYSVNLCVAGDVVYINALIRFKDNSQPYEWEYPPANP